MNIEHLVQMANQIGTYFSSEPDRAVASAGIADHLARFWERRMRESLYAGLGQDETESLTPLVRETLMEYRELILSKAK